MKLGNSSGARYPCSRERSSMRKESRLPVKVTTEEEMMPIEWAMPDSWRYPPKISILRDRLFEKAKKEPVYRFYSLFGQILRRDVLQASWDLVAANNGSPGVDGVTIQMVMSSPEGPQGLLEEIERELRSGTYRPAAVKRVLIPKANGKQRPLGIPTVKDRVVQTAVKMVIEPIFEANFHTCSYGFRPGRTAHEALSEGMQNIDNGLTAVYDADLSSYFDTIPHDKLMACVEKKIVDRSVLSLIRLWLKAEVEVNDEQGEPPTRIHPRSGTPQGGVISPLLANLYLHWFDKLFHRDDGPATWAKAKMVRYADDFVVQARYIGNRLKSWIETALEGRFALTINREKTSIRNISAQTGEGLDFLGYRLWYAPCKFVRGHRYLTANPSPKSMKAEKQKLREIVKDKRGSPSIGDIISRMNVQMRGWSNYHNKGRPARQFWNVNAFAVNCLRKHLKRSSQRPYKIPPDMTWWQHITQDLGLIPLATHHRKSTQESLWEAGCGKTASPV